MRSFHVSTSVTTITTMTIIEVSCCYYRQKMVVIDGCDFPYLSQSSNLPLYTAKLNSCFYGCDRCDDCDDCAWLCMMLLLPGQEIFFPNCLAPDFGLRIGVGGSFTSFLFHGKTALHPPTFLHPLLGLDDLMPLFRVAGSQALDRVAPSRSSLPTQADPFPATW
jgi:hypothetical protein